MPGIDVSVVVFPLDQVAAPVVADPVDDRRGRSQLGGSRKRGGDRAAALELAFENFGDPFVLREFLDDFQQIDQRHADADNIKSRRSGVFLHAS